MLLSLILLRVPVLMVALALDLLIGDPAWLWNRLPHPVVLMGRFVAILERRFNTRHDPAKALANGQLAVGLIATVAISLGLYLAFLSYLVPFFLIVEVVLVSILLAGGSLIAHLRIVLNALKREDVDSSRTYVGLIVGRDVSRLGLSDVTRAAIESSAESSSDGLVAPAMAYLVFGCPGLLFYKLINTADSMIGHRNERYEYFGRAAAVTDDILNYIPARLSAGLIAMAAFLRGLSARRALRVALRDARLHASPNAGWPEAAMAGALGVRLGGPRSYDGQSKDLLWLGEEGRDYLIWQDLDRAINLCRTSFYCLLGVLFLFAIALLSMTFS